MKIEKKFIYIKEHLWESAKLQVVRNGRTIPKFADVWNFYSFSNWKNSGIKKKIGLYNSGNVLILKFGKFQKSQFGKFQKFLIWKIPKNFHLENFKKFPFRKFQKSSIQKIPKIFHLQNSEYL